MAKSVSWSLIRRQLKSLDTKELMEQIKDLFDSSSTNRDFLAARFLPESTENTISPIRAYQARIDAVFDIDVGKLDLASGRKTIREYRKATNDLAGTIDLMLYYVEAGTDFTCTYGDIDARFYDSLSSVLEEAKDLLLGPASDLFPTFTDRLEVLCRAANQIGWGYGDFVGDVVEELMKSHSNESDF